jgi:hypothetical protein
MTNRLQCEVFVSAHDHLNLRRHRIGYSPELMHHQRDWNQEQHDEPCPKVCAIAQQNTQSA